MPIYEFCCESCEKRFEELVLSSDNQDDVVCPSCGSNKLSRLISGFCFKPAGGGLKGGSGGACGPCSGGSCSSCG